jgi:hypothetical protein
MKSRLIKKIILSSSLILVLNSFFVAHNVFARQNVNYWYVQNFDSHIVVNKDSSLDITEKITADCGTAVDKHGIFRVLPEKINLTTGETIKTPVQIISITDFSGHPLKYTSTNNSNGTITWKIGDPDKTVQGVNYYQIHYIVHNTIRFSNPNFDELYWNLSGNFWDLDIDKFHAEIIFPNEVNSEKSAVNYYAGALGSKEKNLAQYYWKTPGILVFDSNGTLAVGEGITASVTFPKNIFIPYHPSFSEMYGGYFFLAIPLLVFLFCFLLWWRFGKDPKVNKAIIPEYEAPGKLSPIEIGMLMKNGIFDNKFISAELINFATMGLMTITETHKKILFFDTKDYELKKISNSETEQRLNTAQLEIFNDVFAGVETRKISDMKNSFYKKLKDIKKVTENQLKSKGLIMLTGLHISVFLKVMGLIIVWFSFSTGGASIVLMLSLILSGIILFSFSFIMPKRTPAGAELNWEISGFKLYMETVDKDRAEFYERENIFEKFLPYAIVFGITSLWIKKMKEIYGEEYFNNYAPAWYAGNLEAFNAESLTSAMDTLSSSIASNTSAPSGSGGAGGAGGGGGGGGGGGW